MSKKPLLTAPILATCFALVWSLGPAASAGSTTPDFENVMARFNSKSPPAYRAYRRLEAGLNDSENKRGWLEAWTEFAPGRGMTFEVVREGGSEYVRNKVLRNLLTSEQDLLARGKPLRAAIEAKNYEVTDGGITDSGLQRVILKAARKSDGIINGSLLVSPDNGEVTRMEGRLVKSPSFWVRDVDVIWKFNRIGGHVVPVEMSSAGRVRIFGRSNFRMIYDYVSVEGQPTGSELKAALKEQR